MFITFWLASRWGIIPILFGSVLIELYIPDFIWNYGLFHALLEGGGAVIAFVLSYLIFTMIRRERLTGNYYWLVVSFLSMGVLDLAHSQVPPGQTFVWLHSSATFLGGLFSALIWLPASIAKHLFAKVTLLICIICSLLAFSFFSISYPELTFSMLDQQKNFTIYAEILNKFGGFGFAISWLYFILNFHSQKKQSSLYFSNNSLLFSLAGLLFEFSILWDANWWLWHMMRSGAYVLLFVYFAQKYVTDLIDLEHAHQKIARNEKDYKLLLNSTGESIYGVDLNGNCTFANNTCLKTLGYQSVEELLGQNMHNLIHHHYEDGTTYPSEQCHISQSFAQREGTLINNEFFWRKDGTSFPVEYHSYPIIDNEQTIGGVVSFVDITERKLIEKKLYESEETYRLAINATNDGIWDWNIENNTVHYSPGWLRILGIKDTSNSYQTWEQRILLEDKERVFEKLQAHLRGDTEIWQDEHRLRKSDGSYLWVLGRGQVVNRDSDGSAKRMIGTMTDIDEKKCHEDMIKKQANYDSLTSLPNRKLFLELLNNEIKQVKRNKDQIWVLFMDLDGFKAVNDTFGHKNGDQLLKMVADRIKNMLRETDVAARIGGDEFVAYLHHIDMPKNVDRLAANLIETIGKKYKLGNNEVYISVSIGIANYPNDAESSDDLLKFADQSMYEAKKNGKNRYTYFTPDLQYASKIRLQIATDIRNALTNNEFELYYQPIVCLITGKIHKAEALIRWNHPHKGLINPGGFIPIAEENNTICDIGLWIFEQVKNQLKSWKNLLSEDFQLSINISPLQLETKEPKYHLWLDSFKESSFLGKHIVLEITEGLLIKNEPSVNKKLLEFRDAGIQVAIDDFGTGYSSLSYLKEFDIDYLKIDQSFVINLSENSREESLSEAIVVMSHKLGLKVIAEGIETDKQFELLKMMGCDYGQGYLFSKPIPAQEFKKRYLIK
ncbi:MAG: EAL domain-containing protein [Gammaproteobacteria bacterium]|nr:EAL domain-containing protein [Gammaproteobacteria bacterium]